MFVLFLGTTANHCQALSDVKAETVAEAIVETPTNGPTEKIFPHKSRLSDTDRHPSNTAGENIMLNAREDEWRSLKVKCQVHVVYGVFKGSTVRALVRKR